MSKKKQFEITQSMEESASRVNENRKRTGQRTNS